MYDIDTRDIYNIDKNRFIQSVIGKQKVIVSKEEKFRGKSYVTQCEN
jgi:hypothetical protein